MRLFQSVKKTHIGTNCFHAHAEVSDREFSSVEKINSQTIQALNLYYTGFKLVFLNNMLQ